MSGLFRVSSERSAIGVIVGWEPISNAGPESDQLSRFIYAIRPDLRHQMLEEIADAVRKGIRRTFLMQGRNVGWKNLAASTILGKRISGHALGTLLASGKLMSSYTEKGAEGHQEHFSYDSVEVGSHLPYAHYHQAGTGPHAIHPVHAKALAFIGADGSWCFRKFVRHPGVPARPVDVDVHTLHEIEDILESYYARFMEQNLDRTFGE